MERRVKLRFDFDLFLMKANAGKFHFKWLHGKNVNVQWTNVVVFLSRCVCVCVSVYHVCVLYVCTMCVFVCVQIATRVAQFVERNVIFW